MLIALVIPKSWFLPQRTIIGSQNIWEAHLWHLWLFPSYQLKCFPRGLTSWLSQGSKWGWPAYSFSGFPFGLPKEELKISFPAGTKNVLWCAPCFQDYRWPYKDLGQFSQNPVSILILIWSILELVCLAQFLDFVQGITRGPIKCTWFITIILCQCMQNYKFIWKSKIWSIAQKSCTYTK